MATVTDENYLRENGLTDTNGIILTSSTKHKHDSDDIPDYNEAFPQLTSTGQFDINHSNIFFPPSSLNGLGAVGNNTSSYTATKFDEDRRRKLAIHEKSATTKIIEIPPEERVVENIRRNGNQLTRNTGANNLPNIAGQPLQKICTRIQKETSTNITFFNKDQNLIVTITGRPEQVRAAQVQILRELQKPVKIAVNIPLDFHRFIIGSRGATLKHLEQETLTRIAVPPQDSQSNAILVSGAKDNVKLCEQKFWNFIKHNLIKVSNVYLFHVYIILGFVINLLMIYGGN
jgi:hypothetical protein